MASPMWQVKRSGISCAESLCVSNKKPPIFAALLSSVTLTRTPFSFPSVRLNSSTSVSIGEPACSPYTCHIVSSTGSLAESRDLFPQPVRANTRMKAMRMA